MTHTPLAGTSPERRMALEMAVTEEMEQRDLTTAADDATETWREEEEVAAIADDLLIPDSVTDRLKAEQERRQKGAGESV